MKHWIIEDEQALTTEEVVAKLQAEAERCRELGDEEGAEIFESEALFLAEPEFCM